MSNITIKLKKKYINYKIKKKNHENENFEFRYYIFAEQTNCLCQYIGTLPPIDNSDYGSVQFHIIPNANNLGNRLINAKIHNLMQLYYKI